MKLETEIFYWNYCNVINIVYLVIKAAMERTILEWQCLWLSPMVRWIFCRTRRSCCRCIHIHSSGDHLRNTGPETEHHTMIFLRHWWNDIKVDLTFSARYTSRYGQQPHWPWGPLQHVISSGQENLESHSTPRASWIWLLISVRSVSGFGFKRRHTLPH